MDIKKTGWIIVVILLVTALIIKSGIIFRKDAISRQDLAEFPYSVGEWQGRDLEYPDWLQDELKAEEFIIREYINNKKEKVVLYVGFFTSRKGTSTHNPDVCYPASGWKIEKKSTFYIDRDGERYPVARRIISKGLDKQFIVFWYQIKDRTFSHKLKHQLFVIKDALIKNRMKAGIVRISMPLGKYSADEVLEIEKDFAKVVMPELVSYLP